MALTTRQQMVKGSEWVAKEDFSVIDLSKSVYGEDAEISDKIGYMASGATKNRKLIKRVDIHFSKGTKFVVTDKASTYLFANGECYTGVFIPMKVDGMEDLFQLSEISPYLELTKGVQQSVYVMYSPSNGYFSGKDHHYDEKFNYLHTLKWDAKLTKAVKKKRPQDAKQFLLEESGYYEGIDTSDIYYVFEPGKVKSDLPEDLIVQEIDKGSKSVLSEYLAKDYIEKSFRLKPLTQLYGSPVRSLFKDIENDDKFKCMVVYKGESVTEIKNKFKKIGLEKGSYKMKSDPYVFAVALPDEDDGLAITLTLNDFSDIKLLSTETLVEIVK